MSLTIEDFGGRLASVWSELRPTTRGLVERALQTPGGSPAARKANTANAPYDARADNELSRLLAALDERALETDHWYFTVASIPKSLVPRGEMRPEQSRN